MSKSRSILRTHQQKQLKETSSIESHSQGVLLQKSVMHSGPLPSPEILEDYNNICPGAAERILSMAEREQEMVVKEREHNISVKNKLCEHNIIMDRKENEILSQALQQRIELANLGQKNALIISILMLIVILCLGFMGYENAIICLSLVMGTGVVTTFINGKKEKQSASEDTDKFLKKTASKTLADEGKTE